MEAMEELVQLSEYMLQASSLLADEDVDEKSPSCRSSTFLNVVVLGNVGAGKSAVLNSLIGHPVLIDNKSQQVTTSALRHSLQDRLSKGSEKGRGDERYMKLLTSTGLVIMLRNDAILLVIIPAAQAPEVSSSRSLRLAKEFDADGSVGSENSLETAWKAETESLRSTLPGAPQSKLGRVALIDTLAKQSGRMKLRLP
ncbi:hypothetical protein HPP92_027269 [Vanilla planifolia]|uniref:G domain-containing protein n=1 Tax=Vanilla planifolia TaxID=51239 RepID=A0A835U4V7_VANPL|nr:hypothetical protein HPP92_027269 [Vanilla planifolia]